MSLLLQSPSFNVANQTLRETSLPGDNYVLSLTQIANFYAASASCPSNQIHLLDRATLQSTGILKGHEHATTHLRTIRGLGSSTREMLLSSGKDGCVIAWDERTRSTGIRMESSGRPRPFLCCDGSDDGLLVAAGTDLQKEDAFITYWDPRNPAARLRSHGSTHSDDITAVHFLKNGQTSSSGKVLLSTSSDGLISITNALEADEDEAVLHVGNWGCSISQGGWIADTRGARIWAVSDMETFSCWSDELDRLSTVDIRKPSLHGREYSWVTNYHIKGYSTRRAENGLGMFVGSNEGDVALITSNDLSDTMAPWMIHFVWSGGHSGIVRSLYWDEEHDVLITGGEDSKIIAWRIQTLGQLDDHNVKREWDDAMDEDQSSPQAGEEVIHLLHAIAND